MSDLTLFLVRIAYLALLWAFVLSAISVIRSDLFGARVPAQAPAGRAGRGAPVAPRWRGVPTHVLVTEGDNVGERADLSQAPLLIGRSPEAAIRLDDDYASTRHAQIVAVGDQWFIEDLGSTNGTFIGHARVNNPTEISLGTRVRIGKTVLELRK